MPSDKIATDDLAVLRDAEPAQAVKHLLDLFERDAQRAEDVARRWSRDQDGRGYYAFLNYLNQNQTCADVMTLAARCKRHVEARLMRKQRGLE